MPLLVQPGNGGSAFHAVPQQPRPLHQGVPCCHACVHHVMLLFSLQREREIIRFGQPTSLSPYAALCVRLYNARFKGGLPQAAV